MEIVWRVSGRCLDVSGQVRTGQVRTVQVKEGQDRTGQIGNAFEIGV